MAQFFTDRPRLAIVIAIVILILGAAAIPNVRVANCPELALQAPATSPKGFSYVAQFGASNFVRDEIRDVIQTLVVAVVLVI